MENIRDYTAIPHEYLEEMDVLNDAEFGRLVRSLLAYSRDGTPMALSGNERFFARRVTAREDRFQQSYLESQEKLSNAGKAGASARWANAKDATACDRIPSDAEACGAMRSDAIYGYPDPNPNLNPNPNPDPKKNTTTRSARGSARTREYELAVDEAIGEEREELRQGVKRWLAYKRERKQSYELTGLKTLLNRVLKHADEYGDRAVIDLIDMSIGNNWQGIFFDRLPKMGTSGASAPRPGKYGPIDLEALKDLEKNI